MAASVILLCALVLFLVAGAIPVNGGAQTVVFRTPLFLGLAAALAVLLLRACLRFRERRRAPAFVLTHLGVAVVTVGAFLGFFRGDGSDISLPVGMGHAVGSLPGPRDTTIPLDFGLEVTRFDIRYYEDKNRPAIPRHYEAGLRFSWDNQVEERTLAVNRPVTFRGWRFHLMSYGRDPVDHVTLKAGRDPGRRWVMAGIGMLMAGTALMLWRRREESREGPDARS